MSSDDLQRGEVDFMHEYRLDPCDAVQYEICMMEGLKMSDMHVHTRSAIGYSNE